MECIVCKKELKGKQKRFCSLNCKSKYRQTTTQYKKYNKDYEQKDYVKQMRGKYRKQEGVMESDRKRNKKSQTRNKRFVLDYKYQRCCVLCGWKKHTEILQFHHTNKKEKVRGISQLVRANSLKAIKDEIKKCILLCPNCHFWLHYNNKGDYNK